MNLKQLHYFTEIVKHGNICESSRGFAYGTATPKSGIKEIRART